MAEILCVGEVLWDCLADEVGRSRSEVRAWTPYPGGAPANVACAAVKLGTSAAFVGSVGRDEAGCQLVRVLAEAGVDVSGVQRCEAPTRQVYVTRSADGERQFAGFSGSTGAFADTQLRADRLSETSFAQARILVTGTLGLADPTSGRALRRAVDLARQHGLAIAVDVNWRPVFWRDREAARAEVTAYVRQADWVKVSEDDAAWLYGTTDLETIARREETALGIIVTAGDRGCRYRIGSWSGHLPALPAIAVDTTGAGDAFMAGWLHQLVHRGTSDLLASAENLRAALIYASAVGALTATQPGAIGAQPTAADVESLLRPRSACAAIRPVVRSPAS